MPTFEFHEYLFDLIQLGVNHCASGRLRVDTGQWGSIVESVEVIRTHLVARKREGVFRRQTLALEYEGFRKACST